MKYFRTGFLLLFGLFSQSISAEHLTDEIIKHYDSTGSAQLFIGLKTEFLKKIDEAMETEEGKKRIERITKLLVKRQPQHNDVLVVKAGFKYPKDSSENIVKRIRQVRALFSKYPRSKQPQIYLQLHAARVLMAYEPKLWLDSLKKPERLAYITRMRLDAEIYKDIDGVLIDYEPSTWCDINRLKKNKKYYDIICKALGPFDWGAEAATRELKRLVRLVKNNAPEHIKIGAQPSGQPLKIRPPAEAWNFAAITKSSGLDFQLIQTQRACQEFFKEDKKKARYASYPQLIQNLIKQHQDYETQLSHLGSQVSVAKIDGKNASVHVAKARQCVQMSVKHGINKIYVYGAQWIGKLELILLNLQGV